MEEVYDYEGQEGDWEDENLEQQIQADLALISATLSDALGQLADQLQFVWEIGKSGNTLVVKVEEEYDDGGAATMITEALAQGEEEEEENDEEQDEGGDGENDGDENENDSEDSDDTSEEEFMKSIEPPRLKKKKEKEFSIALVPALLSASGKKQDRVGKKKAKEQDRNNIAKNAQVAQIVQKLEQDLTTNFSYEFLKSVSVSVYGCKKYSIIYTPIVIAALYLLPRNCSLHAIKKLVFETMLEEKKMTSSNIIKTLKSLVQSRTVNQKGGITGKHRLCTDFKKFLKIPVMLHDEVRLAKFKARYAVEKMCPHQDGTGKKRGPKPKPHKLMQVGPKIRPKNTNAAAPKGGKRKSNLVEEASMEHIKEEQIKEETSFKIESDFIG